ncbi:MAG: hypothetical protein JWR61_366 [Ferruginibacter sp.]|nr:hypothetical protein [Ferruginibacter sp.]
MVIDDKDNNQRNPERVALSYVYNVYNATSSEFYFYTFQNYNNNNPSGL